MRNDEWCWERAITKDEVRSIVAAVNWKNIKYVTPDLIVEVLKGFRRGQENRQQNA